MLAIDNRSSHVLNAKISIQVSLFPQEQYMYLYFILNTPFLIKLRSFACYQSSKKKKMSYFGQYWFSRLYTVKSLLHGV